MQYVVSHFGTHATIVFDGYCNGPTVKDHEHDRRSLVAGPDVVFDDNKPAYSNATAYLANERNKKALVDSIIQRLKVSGFTVDQALNDTDTLIVEKALEFAASGVPVTVVANDTDILVLLVYHFHHGMADICMRSEVSKRGSSGSELIQIRSLCDAIGQVACQQILVVHAISGCDTTSSLFGQGKSGVWKKTNKNKAALKLSEIIGSCESTHIDVVSAGLKLMVMIYGGQ